MGLERLLVYRNLLQDEVVARLIASSKPHAIVDYELVAALINFAEATGISGNLPVNYVLYQIGYDSNVFSVTAERYQGNVGAGLLQAAAHDLGLLQQFCQQISYGELDKLVYDYQPTRLKTNQILTMVQPIVAGELKITPQQAVELLCKGYARQGYGQLAQYTAFNWERGRGLVGVAEADPVQLTDLVGYDYQKQVLLANTKAFLAGGSANNVLLVGARGTGKSTSVKALVNGYADAGLRLLSVAKADLDELPLIMQTLGSWGKRFIIFLDDLSFEEFEVEYKSLKSVMDGGIAVKPNNVLIYATSNRRHLIRETWDDRNGDELHRQDSVNEKISLADRFGIVLTFVSPNQEEYLRIVAELALKAGIVMEQVELRQQALRWEMSHSGRSGRVARQFVDDLAGRLFL